MKPICVPCKRFYRMKRAGFYFIEGMPKSGVGQVEPGVTEPEKWTPYKVWAGDLWECQGCGAQLISGVTGGQQPIAEHYEPEFGDVVKRLGADQLQVNDC